MRGPPASGGPDLTGLVIAAIDPSNPAIEFAIDVLRAAGAYVFGLHRPDLAGAAADIFTIDAFVVDGAAEAAADVAGVASSRGIILTALRLAPLPPAVEAELIRSGARFVSSLSAAAVRAAVSGEPHDEAA